jgi:hypothetical protein
VLAGNVQAGSANPEVGATVLPISTYVAVTAPLGERLFEAVRYTGAVADTRRAGDYYRIVADDRLMWGGRFTTRSVPARKLKALMRRDMLATYPQLEGVEIEYAWAGTMGYALHKMPQIGELAPGYWLASAFGGHGLNTTAMAGEMIARAIVDGDDRWRLFSSYELVWAGGKFGRAAAQAIAWSMRARDAVAERVSRYRDTARRQAAERQAQWAVEHAKRRAEQDVRRVEEEAKRAAEDDARRSEAEARRAELAARRADEQARRAMQADAARRARERVEVTRRARAEAEAARQAGEEEAAPRARGEPAVEAAEIAAAAPEPAVAEPAIEAAPLPAPVPGDAAMDVTEPPAAKAGKARASRRKTAGKPRAAKRKKDARNAPPAPST